MKRAMLWLVGAGVTSVALMLALRAQEQQVAKANQPSTASQATSKASSQAATPAAANASASSQDKVVFTFSDDTQVQQFGQLWAQRQAIATKMAVLQAYWNQEQTNFGKVNDELKSKYNLDSNKRYDFDAQRKVLVEREAPPQPAASDQKAPAASSTNASTPSGS